MTGRGSRRWSKLAVVGLALLVGAVWRPAHVPTSAISHVVAHANSDEHEWSVALGGWLAPGQMRVPSAIAVVTDGRIYVADRGNQRVQIYLRTGEPLTDAPIPETREAVFGGIAVDEVGAAYVTRSTEPQILRLASTGEVLGEWGARGTATGDLDAPRGIALGADGTLWVADWGNHRVERFSRSGEWLGSIGGEGGGPGQLRSPSDLAAAGDGRLVVADRGNNRVQIFSPDGAPLAAWSLPGDRPGRQRWPEKLAIGPNGEVAVAESVTGPRLPDRPDLDRQITLYGRDGGLIRSAYVEGRGGLAFDDEGYLLALDPGEGWLQVLSLSLETVRYVGTRGPYAPNVVLGRPQAGSSSQPMKSPVGVAVNGQGDIYVADEGNSRVLRFGPDGSLRWLWGAWGNDPGQLRDPHGVALDSQGNAHAVDVFSGRVSIISPEGALVETWDAASQPSGRLRAPNGIAIDQYDSVYIAEWYRPALRKFSIRGEELTSLPTAGSAERLETPSAVAVDSEGFVYVTESKPGRITKLSASGQVVARWAGFLGDLHAIALDRCGNIYVAEYARGRVTKLNARGQLLGEWGGSPGSRIQFKSPHGMTVDPAGDLLVVESGNARVQRLKGHGSAGRCESSTTSPVPLPVLWFREEWGR